MQCMGFSVKWAARVLEIKINRHTHTHTSIDCAKLVSGSDSGCSIIGGDENQNFSTDM